MEQNTEQADALTKCVEIAPSYSKITHVTRRIRYAASIQWNSADSLRSSQSRTLKRNPDIGNRAND